MSTRSWLTSEIDFAGTWNKSGDRLRIVMPQAQELRLWRGWKPSQIRTTDLEEQASKHHRDRNSNQPQRPTPTHMTSAHKSMQVPETLVKPQNDVHGDTKHALLFMTENEKRASALTLLDTQIPQIRQL